MWPDRGQYMPAATPNRFEAGFPSAWRITFLPTTHMMNPLPRICMACGATWRAVTTTSCRANINFRMVQPGSRTVPRVNRGCGRRLGFTTATWFHHMPGMFRTVIVASPGELPARMIK